MKTPTHSNLSSARWKDILWLSLGGVAGGTTLILLALATNTFKTIQLIAIPTTILTIIIALRSCKGRLPAWAGMRHAFRYPPFWLAAIIGLAVLLAALSSPQLLEQITAHLPYEAHTHHSLPIGKSIAALISITTTATLIGWKASACAGKQADIRRISKSINLPYPSTPINTQPTASLTSSFEKLKSWLNNDNPICTPDMDAFGHIKLARRIASRLSTNSPEKPTIAIIGELGGGKSSVLALTIRELIESKKIGTSTTIAKISLWPFDTIEAAIKGILNTITQELSYHVNTVAISGLPGEYLDAIDATGTKIANILRDSRSPLDVLKDYNNISEAINLNIVLWIEDLERFADNSTTPDKERLGPIRSLLHILSNFSRIQIILASSRLDTRFDIEKLARYVETLPTTKINETVDIIACFRDGCIRELNGRIDPASPQTRRALAIDAPSPSRDLLLQRQKTDSLPYALATLCSNPRRLKHALRSCLDAWQRLRGELDVDDLISISILRSSEPGVFSLIFDHIERLKSRPAEETESNETLFSTLLHEHIPRGSTRANAIARILDFTFPLWRNRPSNPSTKAKPQGLAVYSRRDYWTRYLSQSPIPRDDQDQPILKIIAEWKGFESDTLINHLSSHNELANTIAFLGELLTDEEAIRLLREATHNETAKRLGTHWSIPQGIGAAYLVTQSLDINENTILPTLRQLTLSTTETNLQATLSLLHIYASQSPGSRSPLSTNARQELVRQAQRAMVASFSAKPSHLANALKDSHPLTLHQLVWGPDTQRGSTPVDTPFFGWGRLGLSILSATELEPATMLPQLLSLITIPRRQVRFNGINLEESTDYVFNEPAAQKMFDMTRLFSVINSAITGTTVPPHLQKEITAVLSFEDNQPRHST